MNGPADREGRPADPSGTPPSRTRSTALLDLDKRPDAEGATAIAAPPPRRSVRS